MQVFSAKKSYWARFLSVVLVLCMLCSAFVLPAAGSGIPDYGENLEDVKTLVLEFFEFAGGLTQAAWADVWNPTADELYYIDSFMGSSNWSCPEAAEALGEEYWVHQFDGSTTRLRNMSCKYCGLTWADFIDFFRLTYEDYVSTLGEVFSVPMFLSSDCVSAAAESRANGYLWALDYSEGSATFTVGLASGKWTSGSSGSGYVFEPTEDTLGIWTSEPFVVPEDGIYTFTFPSVVSSQLGVGAFYVDKYVNGSWESLTNIARSPALTDSSGLLPVYTLSSWTTSLGLVGGLQYRVRATSCNYSLRGPSGYGNTYYSGADGYIDFADSVHVFRDNAPGTVFDPSDEEQVKNEQYSEDTRVALLMELLQQFNEKMNFLENSDAANYFIGQLNDDGTLSGYYSPQVFDEQSKVFTEPVTGAQYLAKNWTYNYASRAYGIALEPGTMYIGDTAIPTIVLQYGDDAVSIYYVDAAENIVQTDEYAYVMVASNECALNGHTYNTEITKKPTCTSVGQQTSTCSVCGDQKTEQIPMNEHTSTYSVFKEPSCSDSGIALYTCAVCGTQYTEMIDSLGHDWLSVDSVETTYTLPPGTSCPDCAAEEFTYELDKETALYTCTCFCGASWTADADVTEGYTKYSCNRCGATKTEYDREDGDGLFNSIGNFIADGISWCTEKLSQLVDSITSIIDTFNGYLDTLEGSGGSFPGLIGALIGVLPEDLMALVWLALIGFVILAVWKGWLG